MLLYSVHAAEGRQERLMRAGVIEERLEIVGGVDGNGTILEFGELVWSKYMADLLEGH